jgi:hypothetical protein
VGWPCRSLCELRVRLAGTMAMNATTEFIFGVVIQAANPRLVRGGAINEGDTGSEMRRLRIASISAFVAASICQPSISLTGSNG